MEFERDFSLFVDVFPSHLGSIIAGFKADLVEVVTDIDRPLELRTEDRTTRYPDLRVSWSDIRHITDKLGPFTESDRACIQNTLHRFSKIVSPDGKVVGLTCRVGRPYVGNVDLIRSYLQRDKSILIIGKPGSGKTSCLRNIARLLSVEHDQNVLIVDKDLEICGGGLTPHPSVGRARRMYVPNNRTQASVMISAVENHFPSTVVCDELSTKEEGEAVLTIGRRGVAVIATAHGHSLEDVLKNPALTKTLGNIRSVTLGDEEAARRGTQKTVLERELDPTFSLVVELRSHEEIAVYSSIGAGIDAMLSGSTCRPRLLRLTDSGVREIERERVAFHQEPTHKPHKAK